MKNVTDLCSDSVAPVVLKLQKKARRGDAEDELEGEELRRMVEKWQDKQLLFADYETTRVACTFSGSIV